MAADVATIKIDGLAALRKTLRDTDRQGLAAVRLVLRDSASIVAEEARTLAPRRTGALAASYRPFTRANVTGVRSPLPYAGVIEYGGTIRPRGVPIVFPRSAPVTGALERKADAIVARLAIGFDGAARRAGWH